MNGPDRAEHPEVVLLFHYVIAYILDGSILLTGLPHHSVMREVLFCTISHIILELYPKHSKSCYSQPKMSLN